MSDDHSKTNILLSKIAKLKNSGGWKKWKTAIDEWIIDQDLDLPPPEEPDLVLQGNREFRRNITLRTTNTLLDSLLGSESNSKLLTASGASAKIEPRLSSKTLTLSTTPLLLLRRNSNRKAMPHSKRSIPNGLTAVSPPAKVLTNTLISSKISTLNYNLSNMSFHESN
jgi:hypothetical protein